MLDALHAQLVDQLGRAETMIRDMQSQIIALEEEGMFAAVPHFQWQARNGSDEKKYLYLVFRQDSTGAYEGPDGKRKVYVGTDTDKIAEAQTMSTNRMVFEKLVFQIKHLQRWLEFKRSEISAMPDMMTRKLHNVTEELNGIEEKIKSAQIKERGD